MQNSGNAIYTVRKILWPEGGVSGESIYAVLDAARDKAIYEQLAASEIERVCLFIGKQAAELATVAPYLVKIEHDSPFAQWLLEKGWGKSWGIYAASPAPFIEMRHHFRSLLRVLDETGKTFFFRYYDPRVLQVFLPTCNPVQLVTLFGPVKNFFVENEGGGSLTQHTLLNSQLAAQMIQLSSPGGEAT